jgi:hypothetical protein
VFTTGCGDGTFRWEANLAIICNFLDAFSLTDDLTLSRSLDLLETQSTLDEGLVLKDFANVALDGWGLVLDDFACLATDWMI